VRIAFYMGMVFIWAPLFFVVSEFRATSQQNALSLPQFSVLNNVAVIVVELAGIVMVLSAISRHHWIVSCVSALSSLCSVLIILSLLMQVTAKLGLIR